MFKDKYRQDLGFFQGGTTTTKQKQYWHARNLTEPTKGQTGLKDVLSYYTVCRCKQSDPTRQSITNRVLYCRTTSGNRVNVPSRPALRQPDVIAEEYNIH